MSVWTSQLTPILVYFDQAYSVPKYSDITAFFHDCNAIYCIFLAKEKRGVNFMQGLLNCHSNSGTLPNGNTSYQLKDTQDTMDSWPTSPFLSENYNVSSIHIHNAGFNTVFLTWSLSASDLLLCPLSVLPPPNKIYSPLCALYSFEGKMILAVPGRRCGYCRHSKQRRHLFQPLCSLGIPKGKITIKDCNTFSTESFFLHGRPRFGKALPLYRRWGSLGFAAVVRDLGYMALWNPPGTPPGLGRWKGNLLELFCGWAGTNHMGCDSYRHTSSREATGCPSPPSCFPVSSLLPPHQMATNFNQGFGCLRWYSSVFWFIAFHSSLVFQHFFNLHSSWYLPFTFSSPCLQDSLITANYQLFTEFMTWIT